MVPRIGTGLSPIDLSLELKHGMKFIVKYFNGGKNKQDLWLGVHVSNDLAPRVMTTRLKKIARPDTPADKRAYMFYLPGKNTYTWVEKKCLFKIEDEPPADFAVPDAEDGALYLKLHELMHENKRLDFWIAMAKAERTQKGVQNKEPELVMPSTTAIDDEMSVDSDDSSEHSRDPKEIKQRVISKANAFLQSNLPPKDPQEIVDVYVGHGEDHKVFRLTRRVINKSSVLRQIVQQGFPPYVMHPTLFHMETRTFELVCAFICGDSEDLGLEQVREDVSEEEDDILGDVLVLGKTHILRGFNSADHDEESVNNYISDIGKTYLIASSLGLGSMQTAIIRRLQVAWNLCCGMGQTLTILETIDTLADAIYAAHGNYKKHQVAKEDPFLNWAVTFLSELFVVFFTKHTERFTGFMQKHLAIQAGVMAQRAQACNFDAERLTRLEIEFMMGSQRVVEEVEAKQDEVQDEVQDEAME